MQNLTDLEKQKGIKIEGAKIWDVRLDTASDEIAQMFKDMALTYHEKPEVYKKLVYNAARSEFDWHNNRVLNSGKSTVELYAEDAFQISKGFEARNTNPLTRLVGEFGGQFGELKRAVPKIAEENAKKLVEILNAIAGTMTRQLELFEWNSKLNNLQTQIIELAKSNESYKNAAEGLKNSNKSLKILLGSVAGVLTASSGVYLYIHNKNKVNTVNTDNAEIQTTEQITEQATETAPQFENLHTDAAKKFLG